MSRPSGAKIFTAMTDGDAVFVDTNVLVHANDADSPFQHDARTRLLALHAGGSDLWISRQVLREYAVVVSRKMNENGAFDAVALIQDLERLETEFRVIDEDHRVSALLRKLIQTHAVKGKPIHDANIVASMQAHGIHTLVTQNERDFVRYVPQIEILPMTARPSP
jgi:predicted nucleic acid-binding protein